MSQSATSVTWTDDCFALTNTHICTSPLPNSLSHPAPSPVSTGDWNVYWAPAVTGGVSSSIPVRTHSYHVPIGYGCCWNECVCVLSTSRLVTVLKRLLLLSPPHMHSPWLLILLIISRQKSFVTSLSGVRCRELGTFDCSWSFFPTSKSVILAAS